jgi:hypothetical protein
MWCVSVSKSVDDSVDGAVEGHAAQSTHDSASASCSFTRNALSFARCASPANVGSLVREANSTILCSSNWRASRVSSTRNVIMKAIAPVLASISVRVMHMDCARGRPKSG